MFAYNIVPVWNVLRHCSI